MDRATGFRPPNVVERLKRRSRVVSIFPDRAPLARLAGAILLKKHEAWLVARRDIAGQSMAKLYSPREQLEHEGVRDQFAA